MKTIVLVSIALVVVLAASEARPSAPEEASSGGKGISRATSLGMGKNVATYSETAARDGISYGATGGSADMGMVISQGQSQYEH